MVLRNLPARMVSDHFRSFQLMTSGLASRSNSGGMATIFFCEGKGDHDACSERATNRWCKGSHWFWLRCWSWHGNNDRGPCGWRRDLQQVEGACTYTDAPHTPGTMPPIHRCQEQEASGTKEVGTGTGTADNSCCSCTQLWVVATNSGRRRTEGDLHSPIQGPVAETGCDTATHNATHTTGCC